MPARSTTPFFARLIASRLYAARRAQGLTQTAVAQAAGVRTATVCQAENNPAHMQLETLAKIAAVLHLFRQAVLRGSAGMRRRFGILKHGYAV